MTKLVSWTEAQINAIEARFEDKKAPLTNDDVSAMVKDNEAFKGKTVNMLRSKVVNLGYYQKAAPKSVGTGSEPVTRKIQYVNAIETLASLDKGSLASFEKASKPQLEALCNALTTLSDSVNAENGLTEPSAAE